MIMTKRHMARFRAAPGTVGKNKYFINRISSCEGLRGSSDPAEGA